MHRWPVAVDVNKRSPFAGPAELRGTVVASPHTINADITPVVFCLAGGGCTGGYFDLDVPDDTSYSMAEHLARLGMVVVLFDHLGTGRSSAVDDPFLITAEIVARTQDLASRITLDRLYQGSISSELAPITRPLRVGLGHSMGAMVLVVQQAHCGSFDCIVTLGYGGQGLPQFLGPAELAVTAMAPTERDARIVELARTKFGSAPRSKERTLPAGSFIPVDASAAVRDAYDRQAVPLLHSCGLRSMIPGASDEEAAAIVEPIFLALGDRDLITDCASNLARFTSSNDRTMYVLPDAAHNHNLAKTRALLWGRVGAWITSMASYARSERPATDIGSVGS